MANGNADDVIKSHAKPGDILWPGFVEWCHVQGITIDETNNNGEWVKYASAFRWGSLCELNQIVNPEPEEGNTAAVGPNDHPAVVRPGIYEHFKGSLYEVLRTVAFEDEEGLLPLVIYTAKDGTGRMYAHTIDKFTEIVEGNKPRFKLVAETTTMATPPAGTGESWVDMAVQHGAYYFKDGSWVIWRESYWAAYTKERQVIKTGNGWATRYSSVEDAGAALAKLNQGPAAE